MTPDASRTSRGPNKYVTSAPPSRPPAWPLCRQGSEAGTGCWHGKSNWDCNHSVSSSALAVQAPANTSLEAQVHATAAASLTSYLCALTSDCRPRLWPVSCPAAAAQPHCAAPCCACGGSKTRPGRHPGQTEQLQADKGRRGTTQVNNPIHTAHKVTAAPVYVSLCALSLCTEDIPHSHSSSPDAPTEGAGVKQKLAAVPTRALTPYTARKRLWPSSSSACGPMVAKAWLLICGMVGVGSSKDNNHLGQQLPSPSTSRPPASVRHTHYAAQPLPAARNRPY